MPKMELGHHDDGLNTARGLIVAVFLESAVLVLALIAWAIWRLL
jgi:hypothetical protein